MKKTTALILILLFLPVALFAGQYTNTFRVVVTGYGESMERDPVESFNAAVEASMKEASRLGERKLSSYSESQDSVLSETWIKSEAHLQVIDLQVLNYKFFYPYTYDKNDLVTEVKADVLMEYLDIPRFMEDYSKTGTGATLRSMAVPGWGQVYNNQHTTGILYGITFWTFYGFFIQAIETSANREATSEDFWNFQVPAIIFWSFNVSEASTSRYLGKQGLKNLAQAYQFEPTFQYVPRTERGMKIDFVLFEIPIYRLWRGE